MKHRLLLASAAASIALASGAHAQGLGPSSLGPEYYPNWYQGYTPTPFEWSLMWSNKLDYYANGLPISLGGCGATTAAQCLANIGGQASPTVQSANLVYVGPATGSPALPTFRALVGADLPNPAASTLGGVKSLAAVTHDFLTSISTGGAPTQAQPACADLSDSGAGCTAATMTATVGGLVPAPPNNTTTFLRGDGTFASPPGAGTTTVPNGGTGLTSLTAHGLVTGEGTSNVALSGPCTTGQVLAWVSGTGSDPSCITPTAPSTALWITQVQTSGTNPAEGTPSATTWTQRVLNTTNVSATWASLSMNQITLAAGTYNARVLCSAANSSASSFEQMCRLQNITGSATLIYSPPITLPTNAATADGQVIPMEGVFTLAGSTVVEVDQYATSVGGGAITFGQPLNSGSNPETYVNVVIQKLF